MLHVANGPSATCLIEFAVILLEQEFSRRSMIHEILLSRSVASRNDLVWNAGLQHLFILWIGG